MNVSISLALQAFMLDCKTRKLSDRTVAYYQKTVVPFTEYLVSNEVKSLAEITSHHIRAFLSTKEKWSEGTVHAYARSIRVFLNFCVREEWLEVSPMRRVKMPKLSKDVLPSFTSEEVTKILSMAGTERNKAICLFLLDTGMRISECCNLNAADVNLNEGTAYIYHGKGRKSRNVYFGNRTRKQILRYFAELGEQPTGPFWVSNTGNGLTTDGLKMVFKKLKAETGIAHCSAHTFRRTFAIWSLRNGMNIYMLQKLMGHTDLAVLRRYLYIVEDDLSEAHRRFGAVDNLL